MSVTLFDRAELLENLDGDAEFADSILGDAQVEIPKDVAQLKALCSGEELHSIRVCAHTIKGMASNLCAPALRDAAFAIEGAARDGDLEGARAALSELEKIAVMTVEAIKA
ncbi:MAG: Hpt domain-containing protein [Desulfuromonadaceae bacterium]|nr:Hpt domain-containing protein [Desulfuromonadaceae bacterium]MDD2855059.1 Hpt domain-containing protein [Desulfuromonadaceae bacterium]